MDVVVPATPPPPMFLLDQFHPENNVPLLEPRYLCNPAEKVHNAVTFPIQGLFEDDHLACYGIPPDPLVTVFDADQQFGPSDNLTTINAEMLCVPSSKQLVVKPLPELVPAVPPLGLVVFGVMLFGAMCVMLRRRGTIAAG